MQGNFQPRGMHEAGGGSGPHLSLLCARVGGLAHKTLALASRPEAPELAEILKEERGRSCDMHSIVGYNSSAPHMC